MRTGLLVALLAALTLPGCATLLIGGGAAIGADAIIEEQQGGGDGLF
jgi:hypothetical protein